MVEDSFEDYLLQAELDDSLGARTLYLNSTSIPIAIALGAGTVILAAVGFYLYDYYYNPAASAKLGPAEQYYNPNADPNYQYYQQTRAR
jgi:hypothetical protein